MKRIRWWLVLAGLSLAAADLHAQAVFFAGPYGAGHVARGGLFRFGGFRPHGRLALTMGGFRFGAYGPAFYPCYPSPRITILTAPPPVFLPPALPFGPLPEAPLPDLLPPPRPLPAPAPPPAVPPPPAKGADVPPKAPPVPAPAPAPAPAPMPPPEPAPPPPAPPKPQPQPPAFPFRPRPEDDPRLEYAHLIELGREAFARLELGRATGWFRRAAELVPHEPLAHFLLAQSLFALGKYRPAVAAIRTGMARRPDWPASGFRPLAMYGANVADYADHLNRLHDALRRHPNEPDLLFLDAYQLWFDGRREEARLLFQRALPGADRDLAERFLRALPPGPVVGAPAPNHGRSRCCS